MSKIKKIFTKPRILIMIIFIVFAIITISPNPTVDGVAIRTVDYNSSASIAGIKSSGPDARPRARERITSINNQPIHELEDYYIAVSNLLPNIKEQMILICSIPHPQIKEIIELYYSNRHKRENLMMFSVMENGFTFSPLLRRSMVNLPTIHLKK